MVLRESRLRSVGKNTTAQSEFAVVFFPVLRSPDSLSTLGNPYKYLICLQVKPGGKGVQFGHNYPYIFIPSTGGGDKRGRTNLITSVVVFLEGFS